MDGREHGLSVLAASVCSGLLLLLGFVSHPYGKSRVTVNPTLNETVQNRKDARNEHAEMNRLMERRSRLTAGKHPERCGMLANPAKAVSQAPGSGTLVLTVVLGMV